MDAPFFDFFGNIYSDAGLNKRLLIFSFLAAAVVYFQSHETFTLTGGKDLFLFFSYALLIGYGSIFFFSKIVLALDIANPLCMVRVLNRIYYWLIGGLSLSILFFSGDLSLLFSKLMRIFSNMVFCRSATFLLIFSVVIVILFIWRSFQYCNKYDSQVKELRRKNGRFYFGIIRSIAPREITIELLSHNNRLIMPYNKKYYDYFVQNLGSIIPFRIVKQGKKKQDRIEKFEELEKLTYYTIIERIKHIVSMKNAEVEKEKTKK